MAINQQPILIASPPRSGTIMLAGLIHKHGIWIGNAKSTSYPGSNPDFPAENIDIKTIMKREGKLVDYRNWKVPMPYDAKTDPQILKAEIEAFVPSNMKWLVKTSWTLTFCKTWNEMYPDALWVLPFREEEEIFNSMNRHPSMRKRPDNMKRKYIRALLECQEWVRNNIKNHHVVNVRKVANRREEDIRNLFDFLNMKLDWNIVKEWINPKIMHKA